MNSHPSSGECRIYPGEYCASPQLEHLLETAQLPGKTESAKPLVNMEEHDTCFTIQIGMPGLKREEIFVFLEGDTLAIIASQKSVRENCLAKTHEFETQFLERYIQIPKNADTAFVSAEYRDGMLSFQIPKGAAGEKKDCKYIVVY